MNRGMGVCWLVVYWSIHAIIPHRFALCGPDSDTPLFEGISMFRSISGVSSRKAAPKPVQAFLARMPGEFSRYDPFASPNTPIGGVSPRTRSDIVKMVVGTPDILRAALSDSWFVDSVLIPMIGGMIRFHWERHESRQHDIAGRKHLHVSRDGRMKLQDADINDIRQTAITYVWDFVGRLTDNNRHTLYGLVWSAVRYALRNFVRSLRRYRGTGDISVDLPDGTLDPIHHSDSDRMEWIESRLSNRQYQIAVMRSNGSGIDTIAESVGVSRTVIDRDIVKIKEIIGEYGSVDAPRLRRAI